MPCCPMIYSSSLTILTGKPGGEWQRRKALQSHLFLSLTCKWHSVNYQVQNMFKLPGQLHFNVSGLQWNIFYDTDGGSPQGHQESEEDEEALLWSSETVLQNSFQTSDLLPLLTGPCGRFFQGCGESSRAPFCAVVTTRACWGHASEVSCQWVLEGRF